MPLLHADLTSRIIAGFYQVHFEMGTGWPESVYAGAMECMLSELGLEVRREVPLPVYFHGKLIGQFRADTVVNSTVILEYKTTVRAVEVAEAQLLNYLRCTDLEVGLLLKFFERATFKRLFLTNDKKNSRRIPFTPSYSVSKTPALPERPEATIDIGY
jgi:GxxExxY protein